MLAVTWRRRALILAGGVTFAAALGVAAGAPTFWVLLGAFCVLYPASGAFVSLSQAALMDLEPERREHNMARWTLAGAVGALVGPLLLAGAVWAGAGWRGLFLVFGGLALALVFLAARSPDAFDGEPVRLRAALGAIASREVLRWLFLLELSDLLLDVLLGFLALYFVDEVGVSKTAGGLVVGVWLGAGLVGSALAVPLLRRVDGLRYLRRTAVLSGVLFAAFLAVPGAPLKLALLAALGIANAGWYPVLKARLYASLGDASGLVLTVGALFPLNAVLPLAIAALAEQWGLAEALWLLVAAPLALLVLVPRARP